MLVSEFDFDLPEHLIAQEPVADRAAARLLVLDRRRQATTHARVADLPGLLAPGDLVVVNDTRVMPARLFGSRVPSGGTVECLLLHRLDAEHWEALVHPGQKLKPGSRMRFGSAETAVLQAEVLARHTFGRRTLRVWRDDGGSVEDAVEQLGDVPLPPYIKRPAVQADRERYQTVYARVTGSVAAPTAGLHLTPELLAAFDARGIERSAITLHVGYGTFQPVRAEVVEEHRIHAEPYEITAEAAGRVNCALDQHRRIVAIGTTTTRTLEAAALAHGGRLEPELGEAGLFIYPGFRFQVTGAMLTNFHLPRSSLLMLVSAFAGRELVLQTYREAIALGYRFYSYGDAMLIL